MILVTKNNCITLIGVSCKSHRVQSNKSFLTSCTYWIIKSTTIDDDAIMYAKYVNQLISRFPAMLRKLTRLWGWLRLHGLKISTRAFKFAWRVSGVYIAPLFYKNRENRLWRLDRFCVCASGYVLTLVLNYTSHKRVHVRDFPQIHIFLRIIRGIVFVHRLNLNFNLVLVFFFFFFLKIFLFLQR